MDSPLPDLLDSALQARAGLLDAEYLSALRLFNGFYEGQPDLVADLYGHTLVLFGYGDEPRAAQALLDEAQAHLLQRLPGVVCALRKLRSAPEAWLRAGQVSFGARPDTRVREEGVWYALNLTMNQDASFYLDTRGLRSWLKRSAAGWTVLNAFAYTGSLGVAALAGGARKVIQLDRNRKYLSLAHQSCALNHLDFGKMGLHAADFFSAVSYYKRSGELFDCVLCDPPFFSSTEKGRVDLAQESARVINKLRPLVRDGGRLVAVNNALFLSGAEYMAKLEALCADGYLAVEEIIPVPADVTGFPETIQTRPPTDPAPFNHPTKIAVLRVKRK